MVHRDEILVRKQTGVVTEKDKELLKQSVEWRQMDVLGQIEVWIESNLNPFNFITKGDNLSTKPNVNNCVISSHLVYIYIIKLYNYMTNTLPIGRL